MQTNGEVMSRRAGHPRAHSLQICQEESQLAVPRVIKSAISLSANSHTHVHTFTLYLNREQFIYLNINDGYYVLQNFRTIFRTVNIILNCFQ